MEIRVVKNNVYKGRKVNEIGKVGLNEEEDIILLFRELINSYPRNQWKQPGEDEICDLVRLLESQTDHLAKGEDLKKIPSELRLKEEVDEKRILNFYKKDIKELFTYLSKVDF